MAYFAQNLTVTLVLNWREARRRRREKERKNLREAVNRANGEGNSTVGLYAREKKATQQRRATTVAITLPPAVLVVSTLLNPPQNLTFWHQ
ncbi:hypothetical protein TSAR_011735 [Trichomalopsis sarcophagae]|uniref:Uncharacterized protein n=1 Tax=Trichomalopsis sarcophagae TaxID=543379 RepID=A0A232ENH5_9HYME|nr:hypothetical protein TSAR_011735 [Trichomalopsis sarcophagae]